MEEFTTQGGAKVAIGIAPWQDAIALKAALAKELAASDFDLDNLDLERPMNADVLKVLMKVDSSKAVYDALFTCLARCTYNGQKITEATFEDVKAREDYYEVTLACMKANLRPFLKSLFSKLSALAGQMAQAVAAAQK